MSLLSVVNDVCAVTGVHQLQSVFNEPVNKRTALEMLALANEIAQRIAYNEREWTALRTSAVLSGATQTSGFVNISFTAIPLPADFRRLLLTSDVWRMSAPAIPMVFIADYNAWAQRALQGALAPAHGSWIIQGGEIHIVPALAKVDPRIPAWLNNHTYNALERVQDTVADLAFEASRAHTSLPTGTFAETRIFDPTIWTLINAPDTAGFLYLSKNCINLTSGGRGDTFLNDGDTFVLDERLLKLGMIWQWKANKGSPYAEDMATYADAISRAMGADKPSSTLIDRAPLSGRTAYPFPTPTSADWSWPLR